MIKYLILVLMLTSCAVPQTINDKAQICSDGSKAKVQVTYSAFFGSSITTSCEWVVKTK